MTTARSLPIVTNFCGASVELFDGLSLFVDGNSKITRSNGTFEYPRPNAFSLPAASVDDPYPHAGPRACPNSTPTCRASCYVKGLAKHAPDIYARYRGNADALAEIFADPSGRAFAWSALKLGMWIEDNAPGGFRWHVSGDVLNLEHAEWIASVCDVAKDVPFWIYTRTLDAVGILRTATNLAVNVSADVDNYAEARDAAAQHGARVAYLTERGDLPADLPAGSVIFPDYALRADAGWLRGLPTEHRTRVCPTDFFGQSESARCGPCTKCF